MSDFDEWWHSEFDDEPNNMTGEMYRACWNASRAALIGEVKPVAWMNTDPQGGALFFRNNVCHVATTPLYSADQLAAAVANERERAAKLLDQTDLSKLPDEWKLPVANILMVYAAAIRGTKP